MNTSRSSTPRATLLVQPPWSPSEPPSRSAAIIGPMLILTAVGQDYLAVGNVVVVGRDPSRDLLLNDPLVSRRHVQISRPRTRCRVGPDEHKWRVRELYSGLAEHSSSLGRPDPFGDD